MKCRLAFGGEGEVFPPGRGRRNR